MRELTLYQVDAFASEVFTGNPAAVCPLEDWLPDSVESALEWIAQAINERDPRSPMFNIVPEFDPLRDDPRFQDLLRRMNLGP